MSEAFRLVNALTGFPGPRSGFCSEILFRRQLLGPHGGVDTETRGREGLNSGPAQLGFDATGGGFAGRGPAYRDALNSAIRAEHHDRARRRVVTRHAMTGTTHHRAECGLHRARRGLRRQFTASAVGRPQPGVGRQGLFYSVGRCRTGPGLERALAQADSGGDRAAGCHAAGRRHFGLRRLGGFRGFAGQCLGIDAWRNIPTQRGGRVGGGV